MKHSLLFLFLFSLKFLYKPIPVPIVKDYNLSYSVTESQEKTDSLSIFWSKVFNEKDNILVRSIAATTNGSYVLAGNTYSIKNAFMEKKGDAYLMKIDANGNKKWLKRCGGSDNDDAQCVITTSDGGFIMAGYTKSNDGDILNNKGGHDALIVKIDANGNKQWSKTFGGKKNDFAKSVRATADGGYIVLGSGFSNDGDFIGNNGDKDTWVLKLDNKGNKLWSKVFGGNGDDYALSFIITTDGGCLFAGASNSKDDSQTNSDRNYAAWVVKLDSKGNKQWEKKFRGSENIFTYSIVATQDRGYAIAGFTGNNDGDFKNNHGGFDIFLMKLDGQGNKLWTKEIGGSRADYLQSTISTSDNGFMMIGNTISNDGDFNFIANNDDNLWLMKLDANGNRQWGKLLSDPNYKFIEAIVESAKGKFLVAGSTRNQYHNNSDTKGFTSIWAIALKP